MSDEFKNVAFIGLGKMGSGIAKNILKAGFHLTVYNRTQSKMKPLTNLGALPAGSPREAAAGADVVITCLMDDQSVLDIAAGENGLLAGLKPGGIHLGTTTASPNCSQRMAAMHAKQGSCFIAAPVSGRPDAAEAGQLRAWVAGDPAAVEKCAPILESFTASVANVGEEPGVANSVKLINNYIAVSLIELFGQVYTFGEKSGVDLEFLNGLINGFIGNPGFQAYAERIRKRNFEPAGFSLTAGLKDVELMLQAATEKRVSLNYATVIKDKFIEALAHDMGHKDWSALYEVTRMNAGLK